MLMHDPDFDLPAKATRAGIEIDPVAATSCLAWGVIAMFARWLPLFGQ